MKIRLGVFFGGKSVEHEVSIITAIQAINKIDEVKYEVVPIYIDSSYVICKETPGEEELFSGSTIQMGDEIVVEGVELYDGKHIE